jgi:hypothetical protein
MFLIQQPVAPPPVFQYRYTDWMAMANLCLWRRLQMMMAAVIARYWTVVILCLAATS